MTENESQVYEIEKNKPIVLLPYCVENISKLEKLAEEQGFETEILRHDDEIPKILAKYHPSFVLGIACTPKITKIRKYMDSIGQKGEAIPLDYQSCMRITGEKTRINEKEYIEALERLKQRESGCNKLELLAQTSKNLLKAHDLRDWSKLENTAIEHFQLLNFNYDKAKTIAKHVTGAYREYSIIDDNLFEGKIRLEDLTKNKIKINKRVIPKIALSLYNSHFKVLELADDNIDGAYHTTMFWLNYLIKNKTNSSISKIKILWHLYELHKGKYGAINALKLMPNLKNIMKAHDSRDEKWQVQEFTEYWDKILSSGSKSVMY